MNKELTVREFNSIITTRVLLDRLQMHGKVREEFHYEELVQSTLFALNPLLREYGLGEIWAIKNKYSKRLYLLHSVTKRLVCEVGIVSDRQSDGKCIRPRIVLVNRKEIISPNENFIKLVEAAAVPRGPRRPFTERNQNERNYQRRA